MTEEDLDSPAQSSLTPEPSKRLSDKDIDRINDKAQKEASLAKAGLTRQKYIERIVEALDACKVGDIELPNGNIGRGQVPDMARRQWAVEQAIKVFNDDRASIIVEGNTVNNNTLNIDVKSLDTTQLIDVLMGRHKVIEARPEVKS